MAGKVVDRYETVFGLRTFRWDSATGFYLNDKPLKIKGVCLHHDLGCLGAAVNTRAIERQLRIMKEMGANAIRTSHNAPAPELLDLCDRMGFWYRMSLSICGNAVSPRTITPGISRSGTSGI